MARRRANTPTCTARVTGGFVCPQEPAGNTERCYYHAKVHQGLCQPVPENRRQAK